MKTSYLNFIVSCFVPEGLNGISSTFSLEILYVKTVVATFRVCNIIIKIIMVALTCLLFNVISLWGQRKYEPCPDWSPLGVPWSQRFYFLSGKAANPQILSGKATAARRNAPNFLQLLCGLFSLNNSRTDIWSQGTLGVKFKISCKHPYHFYMGVPPPPPRKLMPC